jgi:hypothetical protein
MRRLVQELMPLVTETFATATDASRVAFGGGSFAGAARGRLGGEGATVQGALSAGRSFLAGFSLAGCPACGARWAALPTPLQTPTDPPALRPTHVGRGPQA